MIANLSVRVLASYLISPFTLVLALSATDIPADTPISSLLVSANRHLANGETNDALVYYDVAIARDPQNYLTYFKRGATYLSLGKSSQAKADFDQVLSIKPGFEGALAQRAKIKAQLGDWEASKKDYLAHGDLVSELAHLEEAKGASILAASAEKSGNWEQCIVHSTGAIGVASKMINLRKIRAHCLLENGETQRGINDLRHILQLQSGTIEPHLQISATLFYELADLVRGIDQLRKCLHYDPDSKSCKKLYRRENTLEKQIKGVKLSLEKRQYVKTLKTLLPAGDEVGLVKEIKDDLEELRNAGTIQNNHKKARSWCDEALEYNKLSLYGILSRVQNQIQNEQYEAAIRTLNDASKNHPDSDEINEMLQEAQIALKRSKTKDYYKVLGIPRDADERQIKAAYRRLVKIHHPDKAHKQGISKEEAEKKMAAVNEAHEILSDPELKVRYDHGDDPNDPESHSQAHFQQGGWYAPGDFASSNFDGGGFQFAFNQFHF
ncbi:DnaJ-like protein subfamily C member 3 [Erysiphe neolycopersici]|uniref:Tetratricopeptide repeat and J domain-containing co-chaperone DNJ1 n=1 Tax=Erysiphe neolycopersici TaxID=212602 RepID=A0A420I0J5_9PEZI|nr:DnaJ-like protein subfamily C member 3 [Erysiphe neolycopersici]